MIRLDSTTKSIRVYSDMTATTTEPVWVTSYDDIMVVPNRIFTPGSFDGSLNGTTPIKIVEAPASGFYRNIKYVNICNVDTAAHEITVELYIEDSPAISRKLLKVTLFPGEELIFNDGKSWTVYNNIGEIKITGESGANIKIGSVGFGLDNNGSVLTIGTKAYVTIPFSGTIVSWVLFADQIGSVQVDVWKAPYASYPPTVANTITGTDQPKLVSVIKNQNLSLGAWTNTVVNAGDIFAFNIDSVSTITRLTVQLKIIKD
jgi:hypothetical protein